jgi:LCP family protein required for cell wall assembly
MASRRRPSPVRFFAASLVFLVVAVGAAVAIRSATSSADTPSPTPSSSTASPLVLQPAHGASYVPALEGKRPLFILVLGSDARPGQGIDKQRADSIHLIGINTKAKRATILGFPRDSWVNIPGHGTDKINASLTDGGPALTVKTVESITGIHIDFYAITSFGGLINMVNGIGGLTVNVTQPMHDQYSGSNFNPGVQHMAGRQALEFARDRHSFASGDLTRSGNQGALMLDALDKLHKVFRQDPVQLFRWMAVGWHNVQTNLPIPTIYHLALTASQVPAGNVTNLVVPATTGMEGAASVVFISASAKAIYADMKADGYVRRS